MECLINVNPLRVKLSEVDLFPVERKQSLNDTTHVMWAPSASVACLALMHDQSAITMLVFPLKRQHCHIASSSSNRVIGHARQAGESLGFKLRADESLKCARES